ncbi:helix-turn-helix domain-containing protein [Pseudobutyrivibrio xylanivorans]|uniref:Helix-turn-helix domain-containing protein n=1 Tax=Pseudobutyrivibrio xylanivorans TaxID=185007 RepID=A0A1G5RV92_PSEXY|nr:helix-turn-helix transcriptional regulator [Pseudobutyrivibrio xylanivorans]SCZ77946.1 Helix-turn-helix domain-containing protein [Pseudobutyrivibrio xylanivorans]
MSAYTAQKLKEVRTASGYTQDMVAKYMKISRRRLQAIEANESAISSDEIIQFARIFHVDVRELLLDTYIERSEEELLFNRYISVFRLFEQMIDKDKEDIIWIMKQRIGGLI